MLQSEFWLLCIMIEKFDGLYVTEIVVIREAVMFNECKISASDVSQCWYNHEWKPDWQVNYTQQSGDFETHSIVNIWSWCKFCCNICLFSFPLKITYKVRNVRREWFSDTVLRKGWNFFSFDSKVSLMIFYYLEDLRFGVTLRWINGCILLNF